MAKRTKNKQLGKGIRALLSEIDTAIETNHQEVVQELSSNIAFISVDAIETNPFQPRNEFDETALNELSHSIKTHGLIQPITVRRLAPDQYQLISGERRLRASKLAKIKEIPAYIRLANDQEMLEMALVENIQRENLNAIEVAITYQRLMDECSLTHDLLSDRVGKNRSTVTNYIRLLKLPPEIQNSIKQNFLSMGHARALVGVSDPALQLMLHKQIIDEKLSVRAVEELIRKYNMPAESNAKKESGLTDDYLKIQNDLVEIFGTKVAIKLKSQGKGNININFSSTKELNRILEIMETLESK